MCVSFSVATILPSFQFVLLFKTVALNIGKSVSFCDIYVLLPSASQSKQKSILVAVTGQNGKHQRSNGTEIPSSDLKLSLGHLHAFAGTINAAPIPFYTHVQTTTTVGECFVCGCCCYVGSVVYFVVSLTSKRLPNVACFQ